MAAQSHLAELERRHDALDDEIQAAQIQPGIDNLDLVALKRKKLKLKEEIVRLRTGIVLH